VSTAQDRKYPPLGLEMFLLWRDVFPLQALTYRCFSLTVCLTLLGLWYTVDSPSFFIIVLSFFSPIGGKCCFGLWLK